MSQLPPPPPGADNPIPPPPSETSIPPPAPESHIDIPPPVATGEQYEADLLKRKKTFSWKTFGGDGFLVSVAVHVLLLILGLFWIISKYVPEEKKPDPEVFATGAGGGQKGEKAKSFEHKLKSRQVNLVKSPSRIVSKSANASVTLPSTPATNTASFASGLSAGGMSKGSGGGSGGGEGTGIGIGKGGGRNFVSLFGSRGKNASGLPGIFYDCKQTKSGAPSKYAPENANDEYLDQVLRPFLKNWDTTKLDNNFFKSPESLTASQLFIPIQSSGAAPKAYQVEDKCKPNRWVCHYNGVVTAPKTGRFRFWVYADDVCVVRWERRIVADNGYATLGLPGMNSTGLHKSPFKGVDGELRKRGKSDVVIFRPGVWFDVAKGRDYPVEILLGDVGGLFGSYVLMEEFDPKTKDEGDGKIFLFRMSPDEVGGNPQDDTGLNVDFSGKGLIWFSKNQRRVVR